MIFPVSSLEPWALSIRVLLLELAHLQLSCKNIAGRVLVKHIRLLFRVRVLVTGSVIIITDLITNALSFAISKHGPIPVCVLGEQIKVLRSIYRSELKHGMCMNHGGI